MRMVQLNDGILGFNGDVSYWTTDYKRVEIEGEIYTNTKRREVKTTVAEMRTNSSNKHYFEVYEYDFELLNTVLKIEDYTGFSHGSLSDMASRYHNSTNGYVRALQCAGDYDLLPKGVLDVYTDKTNPYYNRDAWQDIVKRMQVRLRMADYGFNNSIYYTVKLETLFDVPFERIPKAIIDLFLENGISLNAKNKVNEVIKLINQKVKL